MAFKFCSVTCFLSQIYICQIYICYLMNFMGGIIRGESLLSILRLGRALWLKLNKESNLLRRQNITNVNTNFKEKTKLQTCSKINFERYKISWKRSQSWKSQTQRNWTSQLVEPLSSLNNSWRSFFFGAELVNTIIILFKPSPFFNRYLTSSISSFWPPKLKISIFLTRINKHWGAQCGSIHLKLKNSD